MNDRFVVAVTYSLPDGRSGVQMIPVDAADGRAAGYFVLTHFNIPEVIAFLLLDGEKDFGVAHSAEIGIASIVPVEDLAGPFALPFLAENFNAAYFNN
jgi:hypothetical protein